MNSPIPTIKHFFKLFTEEKWFGGVKVKQRMNPENPCGPHYELVLKGDEEGLTVKFLVIKKKYKERVPADKWELLEQYVSTMSDTHHPILDEDGRFYLCAKFPADLTENEVDFHVNSFMVFWHSMMADLGLLS